MATYLNVSDIFEKVLRPWDFIERPCNELTEIPARPDKFLVVCFGCSFTYGTYDTVKKRWVEGYPFQISKLLGDDAEVWNFGLGGFGTWIYPLISEALADLKPDAIVFQLMQPWRNPFTDSEREKYVALKSDFAEIGLCSEFFRKAYHGIFAATWDRIESQAKKTNPLWWLEREQQTMFQSILYEDMQLIKQIMLSLSCPFLFLVNADGYPYHYRLYQAHEILKTEMSNEQAQVVETPFYGSFYTVSPTDGHPNLLRTKLTALHLARRLQKLYA